MTLPHLTIDLLQAKADIEQYGYCFIADVMAPDQIQALKERLTQQARAEKQHGLAFEDGGRSQNWGDFRNEDGSLRQAAFTEASGGCNQRGWMLVN